jgi:hypothetical protein
MNISTAQLFTHTIEIMSYCVALGMLIVIADRIWNKGSSRLWPFGNLTGEAKKKIADRLAVISVCLLFLGQRLLHSSETYERVVGGTIVALIFGAILFILKINSPLLYGILEFCFAIGACVASLGTKVGDKLTPDAGVVLVGSVYFMIRAMDNIKKGSDVLAERRKPKNEPATSSK